MKYKKKKIIFYLSESEIELWNFTLQTNCAIFENIFLMIMIYSLIFFVVD